MDVKSNAQRHWVSFSPDILTLSSNDMFISQCAGPRPDIYYVDIKYNDKMASFEVKQWQPISVLKMLIVQTMHSRSFGGKMKNGLEWSASCSSSSLTGDVVSAMM
jgi:hypothetical protein